MAGTLATFPLCWKHVELASWLSQSQRVEQQTTATAMGIVPCRLSSSRLDRTEPRRNIESENKETVDRLLLRDEMQVDAAGSTRLTRHANSHCLLLLLLLPHLCEEMRNSPEGSTPDRLCVLSN